MTRCFTRSGSSCSPSCSFFSLNIYVQAYILRFVKSGVFDLPSFFVSLSDPTRLRILNLLSEKEICVCHVVDVLGLMQPKVSRHLAYLRKTGLVTARRDGKWMHYRWAPHPHPAARNIMDALRDWMAKDRGMSRERKRLKTLCCP